jgi:hypothetical protein
MNSWFVPPVVIPSALVLAFLGYGLFKLIFQEYQSPDDYAIFLPDFSVPSVLLLAQRAVAESL